MSDWIDDEARKIAAAFAKHFALAPPVPQNDDGTCDECIVIVGKALRRAYARGRNVRVLRFKDLQAAGIIHNRVTLGRWVSSGHFPRPISLGENTTAWLAEEIEEWLLNRPRVVLAGNRSGGFGK